MLEQVAAMVATYRNEIEAAACLSIDNSAFFVRYKLDAIQTGLESILCILKEYSCACRALFRHKASQLLRQMELSTDDPDELDTLQESILNLSQSVVMNVFYAREYAYSRLIIAIEDTWQKQ
jgi:hypothetical protein